MDAVLDLLQQWEPVLGVAGFVVAVSGWIAVRMGRIRRGSPEQRYRRWFVESYSTYWNPYLDAAEPLHLDRTYIPLFVDDPSDQEEVTGAATRIADRRGHVVILGDAGSGKTTILKAYGVSVLRGDQGDAPAEETHAEVPFFVPVRMLAGTSRPGALAAYLRKEILSAKVGLTRAEAHDFLAQVLRQRRCVVLLDGLDEVSPVDYRAVRDEVYRFTHDHTPELPTANARFVITCRRHNFLRISDDWRPAPGRFGAHQSFALAPMRDAEIMNYLDKFKDRFQQANGPERFMAEIRDSGTLRLHRSPLVLSMSVGLYARRRFFDIPRSIAKLYDEMINEMLGRHSFRHEEARTSANEFPEEDKLRVLREFALATAVGIQGFGPFERRSLVEFVAASRQRLRHNPQERVDAFVDEIIDRSGLLSPLTDDVYEFAHRSIQEHLVAAELTRAGDRGEQVLRERAADRAWRQVVVFYTATADQRVVSPLMRYLADIDLVLACGCLAGADCLDDDAQSILDRMDRLLAAGHRSTLLPALAALLSATASPRPAIQVAARNLVVSWVARIADEGDAVSAFGGTLEGVLEVITMLMDRIVETPVSGDLVARLVALTPDDPRFVAPLWRCLSNANEHGAGAGTVDAPVEQIVERLLNLATDPAGFQELQQQPAQEPWFVTPELRRQVYPFRNGLARESNLVTLLCWVEHCEVAPANPNRFLEAKSTDPAGWASIEADRRRTSSLSLPIVSVRRVAHGVAERAVGGVLAVVALAALTATAIDLSRPRGVLGPVVGAAAVLLASVELGLAVGMLGLRPQLRANPVRLWQPNPWIDAYDDPRSRHWLLLPTANTPARPSDRTPQSRTA